MGLIMSEGELLGYKVGMCLILLKSQALSQRDCAISHSYRCA